MKIASRPIHKVLLAFADWILINFSFALAVRLRFRPQIDIININTMEVIPEIILFAFISILWIWIFQYNNLYRRNVFLTITRQQVMLIKSLAYSALLMIILQFFLKPEHFLLMSSGRIGSRLVILLTFGISLLLTSFWRILVFRRLYPVLAGQQIFRNNVLIIGAGELAFSIATSLIVEKEIGKQLIGFVVDSADPGKRMFKSFLNVGHTKNIPAIIQDYRIQEIIIACESLTHDQMMELIDICHNEHVIANIPAPLYRIIPDRVPVEQYQNFPVVEFRGVKKSKWFRIYKRIFDLLGAVIGIVLLSPLLMGIVIAIKITSRGPVLFKQKRVGKHGKPFTFYKFRSMVVNNDDSRHRDFVKQYMENSKTDGTVQKMADDPRVTSIGRVLRKTSLDELPQLFNVIQGKMSLVGPRPCLPWEWESYKEWHKRRLSVKPGCTGLWQVSGRSDVGFDDMVTLDLFYIENASPWLDMQLILKTFPVMILKRGGY